MPPSSSTYWAAFPGRVRRWLPVWSATLASVLLLLFSYRHLSVLAAGTDRPWLMHFVEEAVSVFGGGLLFFAVVVLVDHKPLDVPGGWRRLPIYAGFLLAFSVCHTSMNWALRTLAFPIAGLGSYDYGILPLRYAMELPADIVILTIMTGVLHGVRHVQRARERELRAARLESALAQTQVRSLQLQLQPHFLFNALHTISATLYDEPERADEMIDRLGELLRASLRTAADAEIRLDEELRVLDAYLGLLDARFGARLTFERHVDQNLGDVLVPPFLLQPLVENAVRHGGVERSGSGRIELSMRETPAGRLRVELFDDGPGNGAERDDGARSDEALGGSGHGLGLSATAERLSLLYGDAAHLVAGDADGGGFRVVLELPCRRADDPAQRVGAGNR